jgi:hypothetical protein
MGFVGQQKKFSKDFVQYDERDSHMPTISEKNTQLANNKRKKLIGDREGVSFVEILLQPTHQRDPNWSEN